MVTVICLELLLILRINTFCFCLRGMTEKKQQETAFREWYGRLGEIRALLEDTAPILCLTATASAKTKRKISKVLCLTNPQFVEENPDRPEIKYLVRRVSENPEETFDWVIESLRKRKATAEKVIIYCRSYRDCGLVYDVFRVGLPGSSSFVSADCERSPANRLYAIYHSSTEAQDKAFIASSFSQRDGSCRVVIATIALGMGMDFPNVRFVINYGPPNSLEQYIQQCGRAGRDGLPSTACLYYHGKQLRTAGSTMKKYALNTVICRRNLILDEFGQKDREPIEATHSCCDICQQKCSCSLCSAKATIEGSGNDDGDIVTKRERAVRPEAHKQLMDLLFDVRKNICPFPTYMSSAVATGLTDRLIEDTLKNSSQIFSIDDCQNYLPVTGRQQARLLLSCFEMVFGDTEEKPVLSEEMKASSWRQQESPGATDDRTVSCSSSSSCNTTSSESSLGEEVSPLGMMLTKVKVSENHSESCSSDED